jgi:hypothetical protein
MADAFDFMFGPIPEEKPKVEKAAFSRPSFVKRSRIDVDQWFDVGDLWKHVKESLKKTTSSGRIEIPVVQITHPGLSEDQAASEAAYFFGKERDILNVDARTAWDRILGPFLDEVEEALNSKKPEGMGGKLHFDVGRDSSVTLFYIDRP